ncbi:MAG TPA: TonB-dependent receptor, partial [Pseudomonadales bacterium]|nr:TonB-dependent receptor [Pseudomonadales bacterium]
AEAVTKGIELDGAWRLTDTLTLGGSIAWLNAEYEDFENAPCGPFLRAADPAGCVDGQDLGGETLQRAPDYSGTVYLEFTHAVGGGWDMDAYTGYTFRDESTTVISNEFGADSLELLDARLSFSNADNGWMVALKGNNLTDERKLILSQDNDLLQGGQFGAINMPRTYALQVRKNF